MGKRKTNRTLGHQHHNKMHMNKYLYGKAQAAPVDIKRDHNGLARPNYSYGAEQADYYVEEEAHKSPFSGLKDKLNGKI